MRKRISQHPSVHVFLMMKPVQRCRTKNILCVAVGSIGDLRQRRQVVEPVEAGLVGDRVDTSEKEVDIVGFPRAQAGRKLTANKVGKGGRGKVGLVAHGIELGVGLDVLGELYC